MVYALASIKPQPKPNININLGPAGVSGVIAVVVLGLGGSATGKWSMSAPIVESGTFDVFWDTISFAVNGALPAGRTGCASRRTVA